METNRKVGSRFDCFILQSTILGHIKSKECCICCFLVVLYNQALNNYCLAQ